MLSSVPPPSSSPILELADSNASQHGLNRVPCFLARPQTVRPGRAESSFSKHLNARVRQAGYLQGSRCWRLLENQGSSAGECGEENPKRKKEKKVSQRRPSIRAMNNTDTFSTISTAPTDLYCRVTSPRQNQRGELIAGGTWRTSPNRPESTDIPTSGVVFP